MNDLVIKTNTALLKNKIQLPEIPKFAKTVISNRKSPAKIFAETQKELEKLRLAKEALKKFYGYPANIYEINTLLMKIFYTTPKLGKTTEEIKVEVKVWRDEIAKRKYPIWVLEKAYEELISNHEYRALSHFLKYAEEFSDSVLIDIRILENVEAESIQKLKDKKAEEDCLPAEKIRQDWANAANGTHPCLKGKSTIAEKLVQEWENEELQRSKKPLK